MRACAHTNMQKRTREDCSSVSGCLVCCQCDWWSSESRYSWIWVPVGTQWKTIFQFLQVNTCADLCCCWSFLMFYAALCSTLKQTHRAVIVCDSEWLSLFIVCFWISAKVVYLQCYLVVTWLVPRETVAVLLLVHVVWTPYNHIPIHSVTVSLFQAIILYMGCLCV